MIMADKSQLGDKKQSFTSASLFWGLSPRSPQFQLIKPSLKREALLSTVTHHSIQTDSQSVRESMEDSSNDLSRLSADISSILESCIAKSENRTSTSSWSNREGMRESRSHLNKNLKSIHVYMEGHSLKKNFTEIVRICLFDKFHNTQISEQWNCENLFKSFSLIRLDHPFVQFKDPKADTLQGFFLNWFQHYQSNKKIIISFDFLFSHLTLIIVLVFYWLHTYEVKDNPLCSPEENQLVQTNLSEMRHSILLIMMDYLNLRSRDVKCNIISAKVLNEFYTYINNSPDLRRKLVEESHALLQERFHYESALIDNFQSSLEFSNEILSQMDINYFEKDKIIRDSILDLVGVFNEVDMKAFINTPLSAYYGTEELTDSKYDAVSSYTYTSCWLLKLVIEAAKRGGNIGIEYIKRYFQMGEALLKWKNCESGLLFMSMIVTIKDCFPNLWSKFQHRYSFDQRVILTLLEIGQSFSMTSLIPHKVKIYQRIQLAKQKFKGRELSFRFHQTMYDIARIVQRCKQNIEKEFKKLESRRNKIKVNYNESYLHHHVFDLMRNQNSNANELFEGLKMTAREVDKSVRFTVFGFSIF